MCSVIDATGYRGSHSKHLPEQGLAEFLVGGGLVWVDVVDPTEADLVRVEEEFGLHELAMEDARHRGQRPKIERYPNHAFLALYGAAPEADDLPELHVFVGAGWVVTVRFANGRGHHVDIAEVRRVFERTRGESCSPGHLLYALLDVVVDDYFDVADALDAQLEIVEDQLFAGIGGQRPDGVDGDRRLQQQLLTQRRILVQFRRQVVPLREVMLTLLRREVPWVDDRTEVYLQDVLDHLLRVIDQIDAQRELVGNAADAHLALVSNRANEIMKTMTSWGAILLGSTLIAGIYGMNFEHMPELGSRWGYPGALTAMAVLTSALFVYFRRKRWI